MIIPKRFLVPAALCLVLLAPILPTCAAESAPVVAGHTTASLVTDADAWAPGKPFRLALRLRIAPGWHTYWKNPGAAGVPPQLDLTLPAGAHASAIEWPAPQRLPEGPLMAYGYTGDLLLPLTVTPPESGSTGSPLAIHATAQWLVCAQICVPEQADLALTVPSGTPAPSAEARLFARAATRLPEPSPFSAQVAPDGTLSVTGKGLSTATVADASFFPDTAGALDDAAAQPVTVQPGLVRLALKPGQAFRPRQALSGVLALRDPHGEESFLQLAAAPGPLPPPDAPPIERVLLFAFIGGLILNLMPCVFPVLAVKALALARLSGSARRVVQLHALSYTAGVVLAFVALGAALIGFRSAGEAAGWGFQFQSPVFVAAMAWLLFGVGLNLSGVFELGGGFLGGGEKLAGRGGHIGSFFTGLLAVVVATPCTAPFMGAAIAAAMAGSAAMTLAVFLALGLGLAAPYAAFAAIPGLTRHMPRPGPWMSVLRQALAFPIYAASVWLVWVVSTEAGPSGVLGTAAGLVLLGFAAWAAGRAQGANREWRRIGHAAALAAGLAAVAILPGLAAAPPAPTQEASGGAEPFSAARLAALRHDGRPVFVDMTASWCITCIVNERVALEPEAVRTAFATDHVALLRGDWTRQDPAITAFLRAHGHDGVPLYVFYPAGGEPQVLPQILTPGTVLAALGRVSAD
jgi:thiol:disulfide interchange protein